jgi:two-component system, chemotaxis family, sensor kinase Cph1
LIHDLLAFSSVEMRGRPFERTDCEQILQQALRNLKVAIEETGAVVSHEVLPTVMGDGIQLIQVFQNLVGNAIKFKGPRPPEVQVRSERKGSHWLFVVRDNGIGIDPKFFDRIFVIFQRLHTRQQYAGTGMGLAICKKIIERHGGQIRVESKPNEGAAFFFTLPAIS